MLENDARLLVVDAARRWLGLNGADGSKRIVLDAYNKITPLPRGYRMPMNQPWCAATVSALAYVTGTLDIIPPECSCPYMIEGFKRLGTWVEADGFVPGPGDIIFYDWQDTGKGDNVGVADHVGVVEEVKGYEIVVIEGNRHDAVDRRRIHVAGRYIRGYGAPDYRGHAIDESVGKLAMLYVINSPDYWSKECRSGTVKWLPELIGKAANQIQAKGIRCTTAKAGIDRLVAAGVINSPDYWSKVWPGNSNIAELLKALGGAVAV